MFLFGHCSKVLRSQKNTTRPLDTILFTLRNYSLVQWNWFSGVDGCVWISCTQWYKRTKFTARSCTVKTKYSLVQWNWFSDVTDACNSDASGDCTRLYLIILFFFSEVFVLISVKSQAGSVLISHQTPGLCSSAQCFSSCDFAVVMHGSSTSRKYPKRWSKEPKSNQKGLSGVNTLSGNWMLSVFCLPSCDKCPWLVKDTFKHTQGAVPSTVNYCKIV